MKLTVTKPVEIEAKYIHVIAPVRYGEDDIPQDFPFRRRINDTDSEHLRDAVRRRRYSDVWDVVVDIDTGQIVNWPAGVTGNCHMKVCDEGFYLLYGNDLVLGPYIATIDGDYVPSCIPGSYGDYIAFEIDGDGNVKHWNAFCNANSIRKSFFRSNDD